MDSRTQGLQLQGWASENFSRLRQSQERRQSTSCTSPVCGRSPSSRKLITQSNTTRGGGNHNAGLPKAQVHSPSPQDHSPQRVSARKKGVLNSRRAEVCWQLMKHLNNRPCPNVCPKSTPHISILQVLCLVVSCHSNHRHLSVLL